MQRIAWSNMAIINWLKCQPKLALFIKSGSGCSTLGSLTTSSSWHFNAQVFSYHFCINDQAPIKDLGRPATNDDSEEYRISFCGLKLGSSLTTYEKCVRNMAMRWQQGDDHDIEHAREEVQWDSISIKQNDAPINSSNCTRTLHTNTKLDQRKL